MRGRVGYAGFVPTAEFEMVSPKFLIGVTAFLCATAADAALPVPARPAPSYADARARVVELFQARLKDPESARYTMDSVRRSSCRQGLFGRGGRIYGWSVEVTVNAKNSFGGYNGPEPYTVTFRDDGQIGLENGLNFGFDGHGACRWEDDEYVQVIPR